MKLPHSWLSAIHGWVHVAHGFLRSVLAAVLGFIPAHFARAEIMVVHSTAELHAAVNKAKSGDKILLAPGQYSNFKDQISRSFAPSGLTITSQTPGAPASISGVNIFHWQYVTFSNLVVTNAPEQNGVFSLRDANYATLDHLDLDGGGARGIGVNIGEGCTHCTVQNSLIHDVGGGFSITGTQLSGYPNMTAIPNPGPVLISNNEIYHNRDDGIHGTYSNHTTVVHNTFHDMADPGDGSHPDAIQFENLPYGVHYPMDDEVIVDNWFYQGESKYGMQGVFLHGGQSPEQKFHRAVIERNTVCIATQYNGVFLTGGVDFSVRDNYVVGQIAMKIVVGQGLNGVVSGNTSNGLALADNSKVTETKNKTIGVPRDCALATSHAIQTGAGATARATLGPGGVTP